MLISRRVLGSLMQSYTCNKHFVFSLNMPMYEILKNEEFLSRIASGRGGIAWF